MDTFPKFTMAGYRDLLVALLKGGAQFSPMTKIRNSAAGDVFLRHDLDISIELSLPMARLEQELGVTSTYYVLLSGHYNPLSAASASAMRELIRLGHDLGLHYDLSLYPNEGYAALARLSREVDLLAEISGASIDTIVMHEPYRGHYDFFENHKKLINPAFYQKNNAGLMYVSDSCRAWRDKSLLYYLCGESSKDRLLLNIHPEVWLADKAQHRLTYLENTLLPKLLEPTRRYFMETTRSVWKTHIGPTNGYGDEDE